MVYQLSEEIGRREETGEHGFKVSSVEQQHVWLLPLRHVAHGVSRVAGHGEEHAAGAGKALRDSSREFGYRAEVDRGMLPLGFEDESCAIDGEGHTCVPQLRLSS